MRPEVGSHHAQMEGRRRHHLAGAAGQISFAEQPRTRCYFTLRYARNSNVTRASSNDISVSY
jgi:hypothetical protein